MDIDSVQWGTGRPKDNLSDFFVFSRLAIADTINRPTDRKSGVQQRNGDQASFLSPSSPLALIVRCQLPSRIGQLSSSKVVLLFSAEIVLLRHEVDSN